jgi:hypothetical protein
VIWKFDAQLEARIADNLKQAAIEEGQWTEHVAAPAHRFIRPRPAGASPERLALRSHLAG